MSTAYTDRILLNNLSTLPTEIVHEILNDLQVCDLLDLITSSGPTPDALTIFISRIYSHLHFGRVFQPGNLEELSGYASIYLYAQFGPLKDVASLAARKNKLLSKYYTYEEMRAAIIAPLLRVFENVEKRLFFPRQNHWAREPKFPNSKAAYVFASYASQPGKHSIEIFGLATAAEMATLWDCIAVSCKQVRAAKSRQLRRAAELLEQYPQMLCQTILDSQESRTASAVKQRLQQLRETADKVDTQTFHGPTWANVGAVSTKFYGSWFFRQQRFPWVPFDKYLRMMMKILHRFPAVEAPNPDQLVLAEEMRPAKPVSSALSYAAATKSGPPPRPSEFALASTQKALSTLTIETPKHIYPPQILALINTITAGLKGVYPRPRAQHEPLLTTLSHLRNGHRNRCKVVETAYGTEEQDRLVRILHGRKTYKEWAHPNFVGLPKFDNLTFVRDSEPEKVALESMPFDERELEWLDAFCRVCAYFLRTGVGEHGVEGMGAVMWNTESTVAEYWRPRMEK